MANETLNDPRLEEGVWTTDPESGELVPDYESTFPTIEEGQVAPLIDGALGWIEAETGTEADAGDHTFFIADVLSIEHGPSHHALVYRESTYHSV